MPKSLGLALVALALLTVAAPAAAVPVPAPPYPNYLYYCEYSTPAGVGTSQFVLQPVRPDFWRGTELFTFNGHADQRKVSFAKGVVLPDGSTQWEFTINPVGPQCKDTRVYFGGAAIVFSQCSDGHTRTCF